MDEIRHSKPITANWFPLLVWYVMGVATLFWVYFDAFASMVHAWWNVTSYTHGLLILPISFYLIWQRRGELAKVRPQPTFSGLWVILGTLVLWSAGYLAGIQLITQYTFFLFWIGLTLAILGLSVFRLCLFPLFYLLFAVPVGHQLVPPMMDITVSFAVSGLALTNIPFYFEGRSIFLPTGNWQVVEACSGVRYILASLALGSLYAYLNYQKSWKRILFMIAAFVVPIVANGLRAFTLILLGHYTNMAFGAGDEHVTYGLFFYALIMVVLFWGGSFWRDERPKLQAETGKEVAVSDSEKRPALHWGLPALAILLLVSGSAVRIYFEGQQLEAVRYVSRFPVGQAGWSGPSEHTNSWEPSFKGAALTQSREYSDGQDKVVVYIVHYGQQTQGKELINQDNRLFHRTLWLPHGGNLKVIGLKEHSPYEKNLYRSGDTYRVVAWLYNIHGHQTTNQLYGKLLEVWSRIQMDHTGSTLVAISADSSVSPADADRLLETFLSQNPDIQGPGDFVSVETDPKLQ